MKRYKGGGTLPPKPQVRDVVIGLVGGTLGILGLYGLSLITEYPVLLAPFGASCVLLFAAPHAPFTQPRNVMGGYFVATVIGLLLSLTFNSHPLAMAFGVGLSIAAMQIFRVVHPPAGAVPLVIMIAGSPLRDALDTMVSLFLGAVFLLLLALLLNTIGRDKRWPHYWWGKHPH